MDLPNWTFRTWWQSVAVAGKPPDLQRCPRSSENTQVAGIRSEKYLSMSDASALLPLALLAAAGIIYLRPFTLRGNDLALILILSAAGIVLGALSGLADRIWRDDGRRLLFRVGVLSVLAWAAGMGFRFWFAFYAYHGGGPAVASFSLRHDITGADIWTTALVLMAFGQVLARLGVLQVRRARAVSNPPAPPARAGRHAGIAFWLGRPLIRRRLTWEES